MYTEVKSTILNKLRNSNTSANTLVMRTHYVNENNFELKPKEKCLDLYYHACYWMIHYLIYWDIINQIFEIKWKCENYWWFYD